MKPYASGEGWTLYHGDCREILPTLDPVDCVVTDPPYGAVTHRGALGDGGRSALVDFDATTPEALRSTMELARVRRWWVAFMEWRHIAALETRPPEGWEFVRFGIWVKPNGAPQFTGDRPATGWEGVGIFHPPGKKRWNGGGHHAVWTANVEQGPHPTMKPLPLVRRLVDLFSEPGETILDPFCGSGTSLVAARDLGRKSIGIEREEKYAEIAAKRLSQNLLPFGDTP